MTPDGRGAEQTIIGDIFVRHLGLIGVLAEDDRQALRTLRGRVRDVARGEELLRPGDRPTEAVVVVAGLLERLTLTSDGRRQIHSFYIPTDTPSLETLHIDVMDNMLRPVVNSRIGLVPHSELLRVMAASPNVQALMWRETLIQASIFREWLKRNSRMLAHAQMAHFFCEMLTRARAAGIAQGEACDLTITQTDLADALGMTPVHVNRTLMVLRAGGMVEFHRGRLHVLDWAKLADTGEFDPGYLHLRSDTTRRE